MLLVKMKDPMVQMNCNKCMTKIKSLDEKAN